MKKLVSAILAAVMCAALASCAATDGDRTNTSNAKSARDVIKDMVDAEKETDAGTGALPAKQTDGEAAPNGGEAPDYEDCDVDLTVLSSTMVYSEVYNMLVTPEDYLGKTVKANGAFKVAKGDGRYYFMCVIADATACCSQGLEFILADGRAYPDEYPPVDTEITVTGVFDTYYEGDQRYCQLINAVMS